MLIKQNYTGIGEKSSGVCMNASTEIDYHTKFSPTRIALYNIYSESSFQVQFSKYFQNLEQFQTWFVCHKIVIDWSNLNEACDHFI